MTLNEPKPNITSTPTIESHRSGAASHRIIAIKIKLQAMAIINATSMCHLELMISSTIFCPSWKEILFDLYESNAFNSFVWLMCSTRRFS